MFNIWLVHLFFLVVLGLSLQYVWNRFVSRQGLPASIPWGGANGQGFLPRLSASTRSFWHLRDIILEGYEKYSKHDQTFVLPNIVTGHEVILPMNQMRWLLEQPDHVLSQNEVINTFLHAERTMLHPNIVRDSVHSRVIRNEMTKDLDQHLELILEEVQDALLRNWGTDTCDWIEVPIYNTMLDTIARISNRVLVGLPFCRDVTYLHHSRTFARFVVLTAGIMNLLPLCLRPLFGPFISAADRYHYRGIAKTLLPVVKARMVDFKPGMDCKNPDYSKYNDYIQWALYDAFRSDNRVEQTAEMITKRLAVLNFAAIQSSVISITNTLFDIASSPSCLEIQQILREEIQQVIADSPGKEWKRASLTRMTRLDSTIRESMRLWGFLSRGVMKKVMVPGGIDLPSGEHIPFGVKIGVTAYAIHHDEDVYTNAFQFEPFRFSANLKNSSIEKAEKANNLPMVQTSDNYMAFSHGRHACPGRFFAASKLKILLAHIILNYDIEPITMRPEDPWLNDTLGPPLWSKLRIRKRSEAVVSKNND